MKRALISLLFSAVAFGQTFDAASVKPSPPHDGPGFFRVGCSGGPGTKDPGLFTCENNNLSNLITRAYHIRSYELTGVAPSNEMFNITARVPEGTTKEQFDLMLRNFLIERFHLGIHHEKREMPLYELVAVKNGSKLQPSVPSSAAPAASGVPNVQYDKDGYPILKGTGVSYMSNKDRVRANWLNLTTEQLADNLSSQFGKPVTDATGLTGKYDIALSWSTAANETGDDPQPDLFHAVQDQLGLKLEPKKGMVDVVVVDHVDKTPTDN